MKTDPSKLWTDQPIFFANNQTPGPLANFAAASPTGC